MDPDSQVMNACRRIVRLVWHLGLRPYDRLPSQNELVEQTGFCNNTITPAVKLLADAGFLENTRKVGRILLDRNKWPDQLWRIAVPYGPPDDRPGCQFAAILLCFLQNRLQTLGCKCISLPRLPQFFGCGIHELNHFAGLEELVRENRLDGILTSARFSTEVMRNCSERELPCCLLSGDRNAPLRLEFDTLHLIACAMERFHRSGIRKPLLLECNDADLRKIGSPESHRFLELAEQYGMEVDSRSVFTGSVVDLLEKAPEAASGPEHDGVLILNDAVGSAWSIALALAGRHPMLAEQTNRQIVLAYALPQIRYEYDVESIAAHAVDLMLEAVLTGKHQAVCIQPFQEKEMK